MNKNNCKIIGFMSIIIQMILGLVIFSILLLKRHFEKPKRKWNLFILDTSKQFVGLFIIHVINVGFSYFYGNQSNSDECYWYFSSVLIDCTYGVLFNWIILLIVTGIFLKFKKKIKSGEYFKKEVINGELIVEIDYKMYFIQVFIWIFIIFFMKISVIIIQIGFKDNWINLAKYIFKLLNLNNNSELIFNLIVFPNIMNIFQFLVQDNFLKKKNFRKEDIQIIEKFYITNSDN